MKQRILWDRHRMVYDLFIYFIFLVFGFLIGEKNGLDKQHLVMMILLSLVLTTVFLLHFETSFFKEEGRMEKLDNSSRVCLVFAVSAIILFFCSYLPVLLVPFLALGTILGLTMNVSAGLLAGTEFVVLFYLGEELDPAVFFFFFLGMTCGCVFADYFAERSKLLPGLFCSAGVMVSFCLLLSIWEASTFLVSDLIRTALNCLISVAVIFFFLLFYDHGIRNAKEQLLKEIAMETYYLRVLLMEESKEIYDRSKLLSNLSLKCARKIHANVFLAKAAGCYLEIGCLKGNTDPKTAVSVARNNHFPEELISILYEFSGKYQEPSTVEAAICHLVYDSVTLYEQKKSRKGFSKESFTEEMNQMFDRQIESGVLFSSGMSVNMQTAVQKVCLEEILQYDEQEEKEENYF